MIPAKFISKLIKKLATNFDSPPMIDAHFYSDCHNMEILYDVTDERITFVFNINEMSEIKVKMTDEQAKIVLDKLKELLNPKDSIVMTGTSYNPEHSIYDNIKPSISDVSYKYTHPYDSMTGKEKNHDKD